MKLFTILITALLSLSILTSCQSTGGGSDAPDESVSLDAEEKQELKQKQAENNGGYTAIGFGNTHPKVYSDLTTDHPVDLVRYQVANCYMGRAGLINSGGGSGDDDLAQAVRTAVINKRAGGMGLISGRKAFQKDMKDGVALLHAIQDAYLDERVTVA